MKPSDRQIIGSMRIFSTAMLRQCFQLDILQYNLFLYRSWIASSEREGTSRAVLSGTIYAICCYEVFSPSSHSSFIYLPVQYFYQRIQYASNTTVRFSTNIFSVHDIFQIHSYLKTLKQLLAASIYYIYYNFR